MISEFKQYWLEALRSGKFLQGRFGMNLYGRYCCLAVLREVVPGMPTSDGNNINLTSEQLRFVVLEPKQQNHLMGMNDCEKKSFIEIADWIEQNVEG